MSTSLLNSARMKLSKILNKTPQWQSTDPAERLKYLETSQLSQELIQTLANSDLDLKVRLSAISKVEAPACLKNLLNDEDDDIFIACSERLVKITNQETDTFKLELEKYPQTKIFTLATLTKQDKLRSQALEYLNDPALLESFITQSSHSKSIQICIPKINNQPFLESLIKEALHRDKNVVKVARAKLSEIKNAATKRTIIVNLFTDTIDKLEKLSKSNINTEYNRKLNILQENAQDIFKAPMAVIDDAKQQHLAKALALATSKIDEFKALEKTNLEKKKQAIKIIADFTEQLELSSDTINCISETIDHAQQCWPENLAMHELEVHTLPLIKLRKANIDWQLHVDHFDADPNPSKYKILESKLWPPQFPMPEILVNAIKKAKEITEALVTVKNEQAIKDRDLLHQLSQLETALEAGHIQSAHKLHKSLALKTRKLGASHSLLEKLDQCAARIKELDDWQGFITKPKRELLCNKMSVLAADNTILPQEKAKAIKELQTEWKRLGPSDARHAQRLWSKFKTLSDKAYKPCASYFAAQKSIREKNLIEKNNICQALEDFNDSIESNKMDWKSVIDILDAAQIQWQQYADIQRSEFKPIQARYTAIMDRLYEKLKTEKSNNHDIKTRLIEELTQLISDDLEISTKINTTKDIQSTWKSVGITDRKVDQRLWKEFRSACDTIFNLRSDQARQEKSDQAELGMQAQNIINSLASTISSDQMLQPSALRDFKKAFTNIALNSQQRMLKSAFEKQYELAESRLQNQKTESSKQNLAEFIRQAKLQAAFELNEIDTAALQLEMNKGFTLTPDLQSKSRERASQSSKFDTFYIEKLCIQLEIFGDIESPASSQAARMAYQVERLNKELSQGIKETRTVPEQITAVRVAWYTIPITQCSIEHQKRFTVAEVKLGF